MALKEIAERKTYSGPPSARRTCTTERSTWQGM